MPLWLALGLAALAIAVFLPAGHYDFVTLDDPNYVSNNPHVLGGLTWPDVVWAFTTLHMGYWIPATWLSLMANATVLGPNAGGFHLVNVALHAAGTVALFEWLRRATGWAGRSAFVAALFAVHPLHVESVAWITERKDVLSTLFLWLMLLAYTEYVRRPARWRYGVVCLCFVTGLMAKPMLVTAPVLLLLVDVWPLGRWRLAGRRQEPATGAEVGAGRLIREKLPLALIAGVFAVLAFVAQRQAGAVTDLAVLPVGTRVANSLIAYVVYLGSVVWPTKLGVLYSYPDWLPEWSVAWSVIVLAILSAGAFAVRATRPYALMGWAWYLVALLPVIGLVQVGVQWRADRFTYVPLTGLFVAVVWGAAEMSVRFGRRGVSVAVATGLAATLVLAAVARHQLGFWRDSVALWTRAATATTHLDDYEAHLALADNFWRAGKLEEARQHYTRALDLRKDSVPADIGLGRILAAQKQFADAVPYLRAAAHARPDLSDIDADLGTALVTTGRPAEAVAPFESAVRLDPDVADVQAGLAFALSQTGQTAEALPHFQAVARLDPTSETAHLNLALALVQTDHDADALAELQEVLRINPNDVTARRLVK